LEFIQQSLDFQDEFDKHSLSLLGLSELNLTYEELMEKNHLLKKKDCKNIALHLSNECLSCGDERVKKKV
jgi:hypothetical protein